MSECGRTQPILAISNPLGSRSLPISMASASALPPPSYALEIQDQYDKKEDFAECKCAFIEGGSSSDTVPTPKVIIDQDSDPDATIVEITLGDRLGALLDTMNALKNLGLNVVKAKVFLDSSGKHNTFAITRADTGRKVDNPELLEATRLTIINNMLEYHPESSAQLAMGEAFGIDPPKEKEKFSLK